MTYLLWTTQIALATVLAVAAASKIKSRAALRDFTSSLGDFGIPAPLVHPALGLAIAATELACAAALLGAPRIGGSLSAALFVGFAAGIAQALGRSEPVRCRCFGAAGAVLGRGHVARNLALAALAGVVAARGTAPARLDAAEAALATLAGLGAGLLITRWDDLAFLFSAASARPTRRAGERTSR